MLDLTQISLATEKKRSCQLDCWARFFKAATWDELNMLAQNNETLKDAASTAENEALTAELARLRAWVKEQGYDPENI